MMESIGRHGARVKDLRRRVKHRRPGEVIIDGRRLVADLVRWGVALSELYLSTEVSNETELVGWAEYAGAAFELDAKVLRDVAPTRNPQGVLAVVREPEAPRWTGSEGIGLWLDRIQEPGNLGAIVRAAAGLGAAAIMLSPDCTDPFGPAAVRGSAGAVFRVPLERGVGVDKAAERMRTVGGEVWASGAAGTPLAAWNTTQPCLILLGAEGPGLSDDAFEIADGTVTIPMSREIESLNVAVAAGILLQHLRGD
jgi:TrmH family RNA methyltransferase